MTWSFSQYLTFNECPRKWYFSYKLANTLAIKEPIRKEAFYLKQLKTIDSWRGSIVDKVISENIIPAINLNQPISIDLSLEMARTYYERGLAYARARSWRNPDSKTSDRDYIALLEFELDDPESCQEHLRQAWSEIEIALQNFYQMPEISELLGAAVYRKPQERIGFRLYDTYITCQPDVILLYNDPDPPVLIDWKVHRYGVKDYRRQLVLYALALAESDLPRKYPMELAGILPTEVRLLEVQLLTKKIYPYDLLDSEIAEIKSLIGTSTRKMSLAIDEQDVDLTYLDVPTTAYPEKCQTCPFQSICWENSIWEKEIKCQESKQMSFLF